MTRGANLVFSVGIGPNVAAEVWQVDPASESLP